MLRLVKTVLTTPAAEASIADLTTAIGGFLTSAIGWMGNIFTFIIGEPLILFFMAVGLAGVMFRWARKIVHF